MTGTGSAINGCNLPDARSKEIMAGNAAPYQVAGGMMMDIMGLSMACDYNRVVTCQFGSGAGGPVYNWLPDALNKQYNHHKLSHGATTDAATSPNLPEAEWKTALFNVDQWHMKQMKILLDRLASYQEADGTVLDNSAVLYINELGNGLQHNFVDLPVVIAGSAGKVLKQAQYIKVSAGSTTSQTDAPANQLFTSLANALGYKDSAGAPMTTFGMPKLMKPGEMPGLRA